MKNELKFLLRNELKFLLRNKKTLLIIVLTIFATIVVFFVMSRSSSSLVSPTSFQPSTQPVTPAYSPPQEIKYDSSTDLQKELDSVDPLVLESDFKDL